MAKNRHLIDKMIIRCVFEILLLIVFLVVSYKGFTGGKLSQASQIAAISARESRDVQAVYTYGRNDDSADSTLVDSGLLALKNPNKTDRQVGIYMQIRKMNDVNIDDFIITVDDEVVEPGMILNMQDFYEFNIGDYSLDGYEYKPIKLKINTKGDKKTIEYAIRVA